MAKCEKCGRGGLGAVHFGIRFKDGKFICVKCLKELGWQHPLKDAGILVLNTTDDILHPEKRQEVKKQEFYKHEASKLRISPEQYASLDKAGATDFEMRLLGRLSSLLNDEGCSARALDVLPGDNGSILVLLNGVVLLEYKGEPDIKWIILSDDPGNKIRFGQLSKLNSLIDRIVALYQSNV